MASHPTIYKTQPPTDTPPSHYDAVVLAQPVAQQT